MQQNLSDGTQSRLNTIMMWKITLLTLLASTLQAAVLAARPPPDPRLALKALGASITPFCSSLLKIPPTSTLTVYKTPAPSRFVAIALPTVTVYNQSCAALETRDNRDFEDWEDLVPAALADFPPRLVSMACSVLNIKPSVVVAVTKKAPAPVMTAVNIPATITVCSS
ncbi:hypothetical protein B0T14DRAFT_150431 [Immersiella caudata]|uniref:Uncharacterized protein n=1 Tax=Immersiella caudata TaxID=314043 RepID=A0AA39WVV9_9PEZI|nr:hypothetical protein B0T14DRAFT_150431 [Immersiella caudata]